jgi:hypothetical protein
MACPGYGRHWYTAPGTIGLRSPVCTRCGAPNPRPLTGEEWAELAGYEQTRVDAGGGPFAGHLGAALRTRVRTARAAAVLAERARRAAAAR